MVEKLVKLDHDYHLDKGLTDAVPQAKSGLLTFLNSFIGRQPHTAFSKW